MGRLLIWLVLVATLISAGNALVRYLLGESSNALLKVQYKEVVDIDGEVVKEEIKHYERDYDFWKASELGVAIISMIELDLAQNEPSAPRN